MSGERPSWATLFWRGVRRRCPNCGRGKVFHSWFGMDERCGSCGMRYERREGTMLGSMTMNTIVTFLAVAVALTVTLIIGWPDVPAGVLIAAGLIPALGVPVVFYPWSVTLWLAFELAIQPLEPDEEVIPGRPRGRAPTARP